MSWIRTEECGLCGKDRCVVKSKSKRMCYCFRFGKTYFTNKDGSVRTSREAQPPNASEIEPNGQDTFDFGEQDGLDAIENESKSK